MENKLPRIGARYKYKSPFNIKATVSKIELGNVYFEEPFQDKVFTESAFPMFFEELPEATNNNDSNHIAEEIYSVRELQKRLGYERWGNFNNLILRAINLKNNGCADFEIEKTAKEVNLGLGAIRKVVDYKICSKGKKLLEQMASGHKLTNYYFCRNETMILSLLKKYCKNKNIEFSTQFTLGDFRFDALVADKYLVEIDEPHHESNEQSKTDKQKNKIAASSGYKVIRLTLEEDIIDLIGKIEDCFSKMERDQVGEGEKAISKVETTEKLPELNKLYRRLDSTGAWKCSELYIARSPDGPRFAYMQSIDGNVGEKFNLRDGFWKYWEEIETHKEEENPKRAWKTFGKNFSGEKFEDVKGSKEEEKPTVKKSLTVERALEELKKEIAEIEKMEFQQFYSDHKNNPALSYPIRLYTLLNRKAQNLVNALEAEKKNQPSVTFQTPDNPELGRLSPTWSDVDKNQEGKPLGALIGGEDYLTAKQWKEAGRGDYYSSSEFAQKQNLEMRKLLDKMADIAIEENQEEIEIGTNAWALGDRGLIQTYIDEKGDLKIKYVPSEDVYKKPEEIKKESLDDPTIPQTPVSGISDYTRENIWEDATKAPIDGIHSILVKQSGHVYFGEVNGHYNNHPQIRLFFDGGFCDPEYFSEGDMEFCKLTDFINDYESEKKARIKLEGRVEKIEKMLCNHDSASACRICEVLEDKIK